MSIPSLPGGMEPSDNNHLSNVLHSFAIHLLRRARMADRESGLSPERLSVLSVLRFAGPLPITRLAELESVSAPAISRMMGALEKSGYATRRRNQVDARLVEATITKKGATLVERIRKKRIAYIATDLEKLNQNDRAALRSMADILKKLG